MSTRSRSVVAVVRAGSRGVVTVVTLGVLRELRVVLRGVGGLWALLAAVAVALNLDGLGTTDQPSGEDVSWQLGKVAAHVVTLAVVWARSGVRGVVWAVRSVVVRSWGVVVVVLAGLGGLRERNDRLAGHHGEVIADL